MSSSTVVLITLVVPGSLGASALALLGFRRSELGLAAIGLSIVLGSFLIGALLFACLFLGLPLQSFAWMPVILTVCLLVVVTIRRKRMAAQDSDLGNPLDRGGRRGSIAWRIALGIALWMTVARAVEGNGTLITLGDEGNIWAAKAKAVWLAGGISEDLEELLARNQFIFHPDYPPLNPILHVWTFSLAGEITHVENRVPIQMYVVALAFVLAGALERRGRILAILLFLACFASKTFAAMTATSQADVMIAVSLLCVVEAWTRFVATGCAHWRRLTWLLLGSLPLIKNEGLMLALCCAPVILLDLHRNRTLRARLAHFGDGLAIATPSVLLLLHQFINWHYRLANDLLVQRGLLGMLRRIVSNLESRISAIGNYAFDISIAWSGPSCGVYIVLVLALLLRFRQVISQVPREFVVLALAIGGFTAIYLGTPHEIGWHLRTSGDRILMQLEPLAAVVAAGAFGRATVPRSNLDLRTERVPAAVA